MLLYQSESLDVDFIDENKIILFKLPFANMVSGAATLPLHPGQVVVVQVHLVAHRVRTADGKVVLGILKIKKN